MEGVLELVGGVSVGEDEGGGFGVGSGVKFGCHVVLVV